MRLLLMIILVAVSSGVFAQQEQRKPKRLDEVGVTPPPSTDKKGSGATRTNQPAAFDKVVPSTTVNNPTDTVKWDRVPQRKLKPVAKQVDYNEIVK